MLEGSCYLVILLLPIVVRSMKRLVLRKTNFSKRIETLHLFNLIKKKMIGVGIG